MTEVVPPLAQPESGCATTYEWLSSLPLAAKAGNTVYNIYEGSKNYNCVTQYALGTVESSVKMAASAVSPVVKRMDKPIQAVDSFAVSKLIQLEEKVPAMKTQPEEVVAFITESKEVLTKKITEGHAAISTRISESKDSLTSQLTSGKEVVCSKLSAGTEALVQSRAGLAVREGKRVIASQLTQGKDSLGNTITSGRDAVYTRIQGGSEYLASTRAGCLVGSGVDRTLAATENWVEYLLPEIENEKELFCKCGMKDQCQCPSDDSPPQEEGAKSTVGRLDRVCTLSGKMKLRMYFLSIQRLHAMQQNCKSTLQNLKQTVDLLKLAQAAREGMDKQYENVTSALKDMEDHMKQVLSLQSGSVSKRWPPEDDDEEMKVDWLAPKSQGPMQSSLDYAKQLSEKVFHTFKSVTVATTYLPGHLRGGATQGYQYAQEMYSTLKPIQSPADLKIPALSRVSALLETQLGYISQLGTYLSSVLQKRTTTTSPEDEDGGDDNGDDNGDDSESGDESSN